MTVPAYSSALLRRMLAGGAVLGLVAALNPATTAVAQQRTAQTARPPEVPEPPSPTSAPSDSDEAYGVHQHGESGDRGIVVVSHGRESRVRILGSVVVEPGQRVGDVVAVLGSVTVRGDVDGDVVAVGGNVEVADGASVTGQLVAVGGQLDISPNARVSPHSERIAIGFPEFTVMKHGEPEFSMRFLPDRTWMAGLALTGSAIRLCALVLLSLVAVVLFKPTVERVAQRVSESPGESLVVGIGAQLLLAPAVFALSLGLAITLIGIPLVPLFLLLVAGLWLTGFAAAAVAVGHGMMRLVGSRTPGVLPAFLLGLLPAVTLTIASRMAWWSGAEFGGWALFAAIVGALLEGLLWTLGAGAGVLTWLRRRGPSVVVPPAVPPEPPDATPIPVQM